MAISHATLSAQEIKTVTLKCTIQTHAVDSKDEKNQRSDYFVYQVVEGESKGALITLRFGFFQYLLSVSNGEVIKGLIRAGVGKSKSNHKDTKELPTILLSPNKREQAGIESVFFVSGEAAVKGFRSLPIQLYPKSCLMMFRVSADGNWELFEIKSLKLQ